MFTIFLKDRICASLEMNVARLVIAGRGSSPDLCSLYVFLCISWISSSIHIPHLENIFTYQSRGSGSLIMQIVWGHQGIWLTVLDEHWGLVGNKTCGSTRSNISHLTIKPKKIKNVEVIFPLAIKHRARKPCQSYFTIDDQHICHKVLHPLCLWFFFYLLVRHIIIMRFFTPFADILLMKNFRKSYDLCVPKSHQAYMLCKGFCTYSLC